MKKRLPEQFGAFAFACVALGFATGAQAALLDVQYEDGVVNETPGFAAFATTGAEMDGMEVTANFTSGGSETAVWGDTTADAGGAFGTGWSLTLDGDSTVNEWLLSNDFAAGIDSLLIDAGAGEVAFDVFLESDHPSTPGSSDGLEFSVTTGASELDLVATYSDHIALDGEEPVGDVWRNLEIDFTTGGGLIEGNDLTYIADTDNLDGGLDPVPEPASLSILAMGVAGLAVRRKRR